MKRITFIIACILFMGCQSNESTREEVQEESQEEVRDAIDQSLIYREKDDITYHTNVTYAGEREPCDFIMSAIYGLDELDVITGEKLQEPSVDVFQLTMHLKHKGASRPERIVLVTDGTPHELKPNFTHGVRSGEFMLLFNISILNHNQSVPRDICDADSIQVKVRYDNGDVIYNATSEDKKAVETLFKSYKQDGGIDYAS